MPQDTPETNAEWRGHIGAKVHEFGRRLDGHDEDIRELRMGANATTIELARLGSSVEGLRGDISRALAEQQQQRRDEFLELQTTVASNNLSKKERLTLIVVPLIAVFISSFIILLSTHTI